MASLVALRCLAGFVFAASLVCLVRTESSFSYVESTRQGSFQGGQEIKLVGKEFSTAFSLDDDSTIGNKVYFTNGLKQIACDVVRYRCNENQLVCVTRAGEPGIYDVKVEVDGHEISRCTSSACQYTYWKATAGAILSEVQETSGPVGSIIPLVGRFYTNIYNDLQQSLDEDTDSSSYYIKSIRWGPSKCDPIDPETDEPYRLEYVFEDNLHWVYASCAPGTNVPGSYPVEVRISEHLGNAYPYTNTYKVSGKDQRYHFQQYAEISSVSPQEGSLEGGTLVTITGDGFFNLQSVEVGGVRCELEDVQPQTIVCSTGPQEDRTQTLYPGGRGLLREVWLDQSFTGFDDLKWNTSDENYINEGVIQEAGSTEGSTNEGPDYFASRLSGFFVPPYTGDYTFHVRGDDLVTLMLSNSSSPDDLVEVASIAAETSSYYATEKQSSQKLTLQENEYYYLEAYHFDYTYLSNVEVAVAFHQTQWTHGGVDSARNAFQTIKTVAVSNPEVQTIRAVGQPAEQLISVDFSACKSPSEAECILSGMFSVAFDGISTDIAALNSWEVLEDALNSLSSLQDNQVTVGLLEDGDVWNFTVTFTNEGSVSGLIDVSYSGSETVAISVEQTIEGAESIAPSSFVIEYASVQSSTLSFSSTAQEVEDALVEMFGVRCSPSVDVDDFYFYQSYETATEKDNAYGELARDTEAYCGRTSLKNPEYMFKEDTTRSVDGATKSRYDVSVYRQVCFAASGYGFSGKIRARFERTLRSSGNYDGRFNKDFNVFEESEVASTTWTYHCVNLFEELEEDNYDFNTYRFEVRYIAVLPEDQDFFIDHVSISRADTSEPLRFQAARPNGIFVIDVDVEELEDSNGFLISMIGAHCAYEFPLFQIADAELQVEVEDYAAYGSDSWPQGAAVAVERDQYATPPVTGSFDLAYGDQSVTGIPASATEAQLKLFLERDLLTGFVQVTRSGFCSAYTWDVEFVGRGGSHPLMVVTDHSAENMQSNVTLEVTEVVDGHVLLAPIPGEFLRTPHSLPQVVVNSNGLIASCGDDCSFVYSEEATPTLLSITPTSGSSDEGTSITLSGSLFSSTPDDNDVTINGVVCDVTSATETEIVCMVGQAAAGTFEVKVNVNGLGLASTPNGDVTFTYNHNITSISPKEGSSAGGTVVTMMGYGFAEDMTVIIAGRDCDIITVKYSKLTCKLQAEANNDTRRRRSQDCSASVQSSSGETVTAENECFTTSSNTVITSISPTTSGVLGGENLTITGSGFGTSDISAKVGSEECKIKMQSDDEITCTLPGNSAAVHKVVVDKKGYGNAASDIDPSIEYILRVTGLFPERGSVIGGTTMSVTGQGFGTSEEDITVMLGDEPCEIIAVADNLLTVVTPEVTSEHTITHLGEHEKYGRGYAWSDLRLKITEGDTVTWTWDVPEYVEGIAYSVHQTSDESETDYDGTGFTSGSTPTANGKFSFRFDTFGTYYYSSDAISVGEEEPFYMKGIIDVGKKASFVADLSVTVGGTEAKHKTNSGASAPSDSSSCTNEEGPIEGCDDVLTNDNTKVFGFVYDTCYTPEVKTISPNTGTGGTTLDIVGTGFSEEVCAVGVYIGDHECKVQAATGSSIQCEVDTENEMEVGVLLEVSVIVDNLGFAKVLPKVPLERSFVLLPRVDDVSDSEGSLQGGTELVLTGVGYASSPAVTIGASPCLVTSYNYTAIHCTTSPNTEGAYDISVSVGNLMISEWNVSKSFSYSSSSTPVVNSFLPESVSGSSTMMTFTGTFGSATSTADVIITIGDTDCGVTSVTSTEVICDVGYVPVGTNSVDLRIAGMGTAQFNTALQSVDSIAELVSASPVSGSTEGGQLVTIQGNGFIEESASVTVGGNPCTIQSLSLSSITCSTPPGTAGTVDLVVTVGTHTYSGTSGETYTYEYSSAETPTVSSISPSSGESGDTITITGTGFSTDANDITVTIDGVACEGVSPIDATSFTCTVGAHSAGTYTVPVHITGKGNAAGSATFEYELTVSTVNPNEGSYGGGLILTIEGTGFDEETTLVTVCDNQCDIQQVSESQLTCLVPPNYGSESELECEIQVSVASGSLVLAQDIFTYKRSLTSVITSVDPRRGGTGGGTSITITGQDFLSTGNIVTIDGSMCNVTSESATEIVCKTDPHSGTLMTQVRVESQVTGAALAVDGAADYYYVDVWSSIYTWGGEDPPVEGDFVTIPAGNTILLDVDTPVLKVLLIAGGTLIFDEADIELQAEYIIITEGGHFEIGTEKKPFEHEAIITMHGHVRSTELPLFGAKTFAVRNGTVDMHGKPVPIMWTHLADTIEAGDTQLTLMKPVTWEIGNEIVIASTGDRHKQTENEVLTITDVSSDYLTLTFEPPVAHRHISLRQEIDGVVLETRAEVGLLTHNVKMRGNVNTDWTEHIDACQDEFDTGMFETQTCFLGRFGEEEASDQYGSQIMFFAKEQDTHLVQGRLEYVEFTHAGQAFRLGRYPIHFHMNGNVTGSYVRGCSVHHTFNRAVTIHGVHNLLVEHNVAYNIMGHAFFLEDGIETNNIIQYNLAVFVRPSSSLLNVDVTPASFWVTNPDNIVRHNAAAGGSHFGFWYNMPEHPGGPSFTDSVCPRKVPLNQFYNNTAHTMGWYGIWIFPSYHPTVTGDCNDPNSSPAKYYELTVWNTERGAEAVDVGAVQFHNFLSSDTVESGYEFQKISGAPWGDEGALIKDSVVIGRSDLSVENNCTIAGVKGPQSSYLTVDGVKFINFDQDTCAVARACSKCRSEQGGFPMHFKNLEFYNAPNKAGFQWHHEVVFEDLDGSFTGSPNAKIVPDNGNLPLDHCTKSVDGYSQGSHPGSLCDSTVKFHRLAFGEVAPDSLLYKAALLTNDHGTSIVNYHKKRITIKPGWMATVIEGDSYYWGFEDREFLTNISYRAKFEDFGDGEFVSISHNLTQKVDVISILDDVRNSSQSQVTYDANVHGDYFINQATNDITYLISGKGKTDSADFWIDLDVYRCYYEDCIPPVPEAPPVASAADALYWSDPRAWENVTDEFGPYVGGVPQDGDDVMILPGLYIVANDTLPFMNKLFIYGTLELQDTRDFVLNATYILIQGGHLIAGPNQSTPFTHNLHIFLFGDHNTEDIPLPDGVNLGSKALGVFGTLDLHGKPRDVTWTYLAQTAMVGDASITVEEDTDWVIGDMIAVATTDYEPWHTETFTITAVNSPRSFDLNSTFVYRHSVAMETIDGGISYKMAAEVGLLTRNIVIEGADYANLLDESFGARVLVGRFYQENIQYEGFAHISNVQFKHTGQEGYTAEYDPRFSLSFLNLGDQSEDDDVAGVGREPSYVTGCSFHHGFSPAIGVFDSDNLVVDNNVVHHVVGSGIIVASSGVQLLHNLVMLSIAPATYQDRAEVENLLWDGGIHIEKADDLVMHDNAVAGAERAAFRMKGEACDDAVSMWKDNVAHSSIQGIMLFRQNQKDCSRVANFLVYRCYHYGIYTQISSGFQVTNMTLVDNNNGIMPISYAPTSLSHVKEDREFRYRNVAFVGTSDDFDCASNVVSPEVANSVAHHMFIPSPQGGVVGLLLTSYWSTINLAPHHGFQGSSSYPAIGGVTRLEDVTFANFNDRCGSRGRAMMTNNLGGVDAQHPTEVQDVRFVDTDMNNRIFIHRPPVGKVNPSDCVDMDCDGMKKVLIRDLDGSITGARRTIISQSAFEWDGDDQRRGLGDYRIPRMLLTDPATGDMFPVEDKAPNKGIIGEGGDKCDWEEDWTAYKCTDLEHTMMIIESMDADTEVRRLSPVALLSEGWVDLINGPQDQGWCLGYTCQERISTFYNLVATGKDYELYFTGTNPQNMRLYLLNADDSQSLVVGIWYANPQRLDVYSNGLYILPNNGEYVNGKLQYKQSTEDFKPQVSSTINGENYFYKANQMLFVVLRGSNVVEIKTTPVVILTFGVPAVQVDDFFEENLLQNLVDLLGVSPDKIRVVEIISESSRKRRRRAEGEAEVVIEIGNQVSSNSSSVNGTNSTAAAEGDLSFNDLLDIQGTVANEFQEGSLGSSLNLTITSLAMTDPEDAPVDPTGGVRATNETGGPSDGNQTFAEIQAEEEAAKLEELGQAVVYLTPTALIMAGEPSEASELAPFPVQPSIKVVDQDGNLVTSLGHSSSPWLLTASIAEHPAGVMGQLLGNITLPFQDGWANFTNLALDLAGSGYILEFTITYPESSTLSAVRTSEITVTPRQLTVTQSGATGTVYAGEAFAVDVDVVDVATGTLATDLADMGYSTWTAEVSLYQPANYRGQLSGQTSVTIDVSTGQARFSGLVIDVDGFGYVLNIDGAANGTDAYSFSAQLAAFDVEDRNAVTHTGNQKDVTLTFDRDFSIVSGKKDAFIANFRNNVAYKYSNVTFFNFTVSQGSILLAFSLVGDTDSTLALLYEDLQNGDVVVTFEGNRLEASPLLLVDGEEYTVEAPPSEIPVWAIIVIIVICIILLIIIVIVCNVNLSKNTKINQSDVLPMVSVEGIENKSFSSKPNEESPTGSRSTLLTPDQLTFNNATSSSHLSLRANQKGDHTPKLVNKHLFVRDDDRASIRSTNSNSPRRTPEVEVSPLPPGFMEGQEEREKEDRSLMLIHIKNADGTTQRIGEVVANWVGTLSNLRQDIVGSDTLPPKVQEKPFLFVKAEQLSDYQSIEEKNVSVSEAYAVNGIALIRWCSAQESTEKCVCGLVGQFYCSLCDQQAYCSPQCQASDWPRHTVRCSSLNTNAK